MSFTPEETVFISCFDHSSRTSAILDITTALGTTDDPELRNFCGTVIDKLARTSDADFLLTDFTVYEEGRSHGRY